MMVGGKDGQMQSLFKHGADLDINLIFQIDFRGTYVPISFNVDKKGQAQSESESVLTQQNDPY